MLPLNKRKRKCWTLADLSLLQRCIGVFVSTSVKATWGIVNKPESTWFLLHASLLQYTHMNCNDWKRFLFLELIGWYAPCHWGPVCAFFAMFSIVWCECFLTHSLPMSRDSFDSWGIRTYVHAYCKLHSCALDLGYTSSFGLNIALSAKFLYSFFILPEFVSFSLSPYFETFIDHHDILHVLCNNMWYKLDQNSAHPLADADVHLFLYIWSFSCVFTV